MNSDKYLKITLKEKFAQTYVEKIQKEVLQLTENFDWGLGNYNGGYINL